MQINYQSAIDNFHQVKKLSVASKCHQILWEKGNSNIVQDQLQEHQARKTEKLERRLIQHSNNQQKARSQSINLDNFSQNIHEDYREISGCQLEDNRPKAMSNAQKTEKFPSANQDRISQFQQQPLITQNCNNSKLSFSQSAIKKPFLNFLSQSSYSSNLFKSSKVSFQKKKSKLKQFKEQFNSSLSQEEVFETQVIKINTLSRYEQEMQLKSFPKDQFCHSFYTNQEHLPHRLIVNKKYKNKLKTSKRSKQCYAKTVAHQNFTKPSHFIKDIDSQSMKHENQQKNKSITQENQNQLTIEPQTLQFYNFQNASHQSQVVAPNKQFYQRNSDGLIIHQVASPSNGLIDLLEQREVSRRKMSQPFKRVIDLNPKPCQSFILDAHEQETENNSVPINYEKSLQTCYQQELKRRQEANQILISLINMKLHAHS